MFVEFNEPSWEGKRANVVDGLEIAGFPCEPCDVDGCVRVKETPELIPLAEIPMYPSSHEIRDAEPIF